MHVLYGCSMYDCCLYFSVAVCALQVLYVFYKWYVYFTGAVLSSYCAYFTAAVFTSHLLNVLQMSCVYCTVQMLCVLDRCCMSF
jgi:hypothetical protein